MPLTRNYSRSYYGLDEDKDPITWEDIGKANKTKGNYKEEWEAQKSYRAMDEGIKPLTPFDEAMMHVETGKMTGTTSQLKLGGK